MHLRTRGLPEFTIVGFHPNIFLIVYIWYSLDSSECQVSMAYYMRVLYRCHVVTCMHTINESTETCNIYAYMCIYSASNPSAVPHTWGHFYPYKSTPSIELQWFSIVRVYCANKALPSRYYWHYLIPSYFSFFASRSDF